MKKLNIIQDFILRNYNPEEENTERETPEIKIENYFSICAHIYDAFYNENILGNPERKIKSNSDLFYEWCSGLPDILDTSKIFIHDENDILHKYEFFPNFLDDEEKEEYFSNLIYDEIIKASEICVFLQSNHLQIVKKLDVVKK